jgi:hypothetical protein
MICLDHCFLNSAAVAELCYPWRSPNSFWAVVVEAAMVSPCFAAVFQCDFFVRTVGRR